MQFFFLALKGLIENGVDPDQLASDQQSGLGGLQNVCSNINFLLE